MKCHPFVYLCLLVTFITTINVVYITKSNRKLSTGKKIDSQKYSNRFKVTLLESDETTILSRIRYPDRKACIYYGHLKATVGTNLASTKKTKLVMGIASVARPPGVDYLSKTLHAVIDSMDEYESEQVVIVVAMMDKDKKLREDRAKRLYRKFKEDVDSGLVIVIGPGANIYPNHDYSSMKRRPFNNTVQRMEWQSKLSLDFAFLFSYCSQLGEFFMNLEDDIVPKNHFVNETFLYIDERTEKDEDFWSSIQFSNYLSIGRLYRSTDLPRLVQLILISFTRQPVDFIMHHFDVLEMADNFREFRRKPPLLEHRGSQSTIDVESMRAKVTKRYDPLKAKNPPAVLTTNISHWQDYRLESSYKPGLGHFFWGRQFQSGDVIDVTFGHPLPVSSVTIVSGFDKEEDRPGQDKILDAKLLSAQDERCQVWKPLSARIDSDRGRVMHKSKLGSGRGVRMAKCIRIQVLKGNSDWLIVRLIQIGLGIQVL